MGFTRDGKTLVSGSYDNTVKLWDVPAAKESKTFGIGTTQIHGAAITPDGRIVAVADGDIKFMGEKASPQANLHLIDVATGKQRVFSDPKTDRRCVAFSPDGRTVAAGNDDGIVKLWDVESGKELHTLNPQSVLCLAFTPDGKSLAAGKRDSTTMIWDAITGKEKMSLKGQGWGVHSIAFTGDGAILVTGNGVGEVTFWEMSTGKAVLTLKAHGSLAQVDAVAFSADGKTLISAGGEAKVPGEIKVWDVTINK